MNNNYIFFILGDSGSGKTTICNLLKEKYGLTFVNSYTTRPKRFDGEIGHEFVTTDEFKALKDNGLICAYTLYNDYEYGATIEQVENNDLYVIDYDGLEYFKNNYNGTKKIHSIFISASKEECEKRMSSRGDSNNNISSRLKNDEIVFKDIMFKCDTIFINNDLNYTVQQIHSHIENVQSGKCNGVNTLYF